LGFHTEELPEEHLVGLDPQEHFAEMDEDRYVEDAIRVQVEVLDNLMIKKTLEEVARWESQPALHESREHRDLVGVFLHRLRISRGGAPHVDLSLRNPLFSSANRSSVFTLDIFHSLFGFEHGGDTGSVGPPVDPVASSRDLFFPVVFLLFDGKGFILKRQWLFTRICSRAARGGYQRRRTWIYGLRRGDSVHWQRTLGSICFE
jgi:hypothetical protein